MAEEKRLEAIQDEIRLLKGEVKQSLASVRDYLLNMELPSSEFSTILAALGGDGTQKVTIDGSIANALGNKAAEAVAGGEDVETTEETFEDELEQPAEDDDLIDVEEPDEEETETITEDDHDQEQGGSHGDGSVASQEEALEEEAFNEPDNLGEFEGLDGSEDIEESEGIDELEGLDEQDEVDDELTEDDSETPEEEEHPVDYERTGTATAEEEKDAIPKVNMLANLITWISRAKKEIGTEQLPVFLEVYGISGHLSPELKEIILHLAEISADRSDGVNAAEVWGQSMLSLHGILTGGDAPLHPVIPSLSEAESEEEPQEEEIIEVDKARESPVKLKLVFPNGDGKNKEFCIDLNPEENTDNSSNNKNGNKNKKKKKK
ncbi:MAG: hypothetical protein JXA51_06665 [Dehalococcoidales bacterium]|nr:hypothetical protein [Dehalococcoidales bacterium]